MLGCIERGGAASPFNKMFHWFLLMRGGLEHLPLEPTCLLWLCVVLAHLHSIVLYRQGDPELDTHWPSRRGSLSWWAVGRASYLSYKIYRRGVEQRFTPWLIARGRFSEVGVFFMSKLLSPLV